MKKTTYINNEERIELGTTDIDAFYEESAPHYMNPGHHNVKLAHYELVPAKTVHTRTDVYTTKPYVLLDLVDKNTGDAMTTRLYSNFVPYFMDQIAAQTDGAIAGMKLSEVLKYIGTHSIEVWVTYDSKNGTQVNYREPRK